MKQQITNMSKKKFRIGELAKELQIKKFVIRFWEKEFELQATRSDGGQRYYTDEDLKTFKEIKYLLYDQGYTIVGARTQLDQILKRENPTIEAKPKETDSLENREIRAATKIIEKPVPYIPKEFLAKVETLKNKLIELKQALD